MVKNSFFHSPLLCTSNNAVIDESEQQEIISQKRSFDSHESSSSSKSRQSQRKYVSLSELNHGVEAVWNAHAPTTTTATTTTTTETVIKSCNVVDLDDDVSSDHSGSKRNNKKEGGKGHDHDGDAPVVIAPNEEDIQSVEEEALLVAWSHIAKQLEEEIAQGIVPKVTEVPAVMDDDDDLTQGSDNSKCSFEYEKPITKEKSNSKKKKNASKKVSSSSDHEEVLKSLYDTNDPHQPVLDKTPSKMGLPIPEEQLDNTTCTWSESAESTIPTVIYIRRDVPPVVPDDEALGQNYTPQQLRAIYDYTQRIQDSTGTSTTSKSSYLMKGLRFLTLGAIGSKEVPTTPVLKQLKKIHLDDDASEAFHQTLIDI